MLHTNKESYRLKSLQQQSPESGANSNPPKPKVRSVGDAIGVPVPGRDLEKPLLSANTNEGREAISATRTQSGNTQAEVRDQNPNLSFSLGSYGPDVESLQKALGFRGNQIDGKFGPKTLEAVQNRQRELGLDANGIADKDFIEKIKQISAPFPFPPKRPTNIVPNNSGRTKVNPSPKGNNNSNSLATELVKDLESVNRFLDAHNRTYGERGSIISNRNGIVGVIWQLSDPDSRRFARELGMEESKILAYGKSLGLDDNKVTDGLIRMALIAAVSLITSGLASVAVELFGINYGTHYEQGPAMNIINKFMGGKGDMTSKRRDVLMDSRTTSRDVEAVGTALRARNLLPNNIRADVKKILSSDFFLIDMIADIFGNAKKKEMNALIDQFQGAKNLDQAEAILTQIVQIATEEYSKKRDERKQMANSQNIDRPLDVSYFDEVSENKERDKVFDSLADSLKAIRDLKAKNDKIQGKGFDQKRYERETGNIQTVLDATYGKPEGRKGFKKTEMKLSSSQAYAPALPKDLNPSTLGDMLEKMANTVIPGDKYTMLANLMRGVNFHSGVSFKPDEFVEAFQNMRWLNNDERKAINKSILSNTGRQKNQQFNGINPVDSIAVMELNGQKVYFRGVCTNVLPNIEDINTVIEVSRSVPMTLVLATGLGQPSPSQSSPSQPKPTEPVVTKPAESVITKPAESGAPVNIVNASTTAPSGAFANPATVSSVTATPTNSVAGSVANSVKIIPRVPGFRP